MLEIIKSIFKEINIILGVPLISFIVGIIGTLVTFFQKDNKNKWVRLVTAILLIGGEQVLHL